MTETKVTRPESLQEGTLLADPFGLIYLVASYGATWCWSEEHGWRESLFHNLNDDSDYDRAHFADHLVPVSVDELPAGAR